MTELCMLASDWGGAMPTDGLMVEQKIDGWRAIYFRGIDGQPRLWTRGGIPIEGIEHILHRLALMEREAGEPMVFDGEFQVGGTLAATKAWCERGWKLGGEAGIFHAFDCLTDAEWRAGGSDAPLYERKARLRELFDASEDAGDGWTWREGSRGREEPIAVQILTDSWLFDDADVIAEARRVWAAGGEGLMLKDPMSTYRRKRSDAWQKVKQENMHKWSRCPIAA